MHNSATAAFNQQQQQRDQQTKKQQQVAAWSAQVKQVEAAMSARQADMEVLLAKSNGSQRENKNPQTKQTSNRSNASLNMTQQLNPAPSAVLTTSQSTRSKSNKRTTQQASTKNSSGAIDFYGKQAESRYSTTNSTQAQGANGSRFYNTQGFSAGMLKGLAQKAEEETQAQDGAKHQKFVRDQIQDSVEDEESSVVGNSHRASKQRQLGNPNPTRYQEEVSEKANYEKVEASSSGYTRQRSRGRPQDTNADNSASLSNDQDKSQNQDASPQQEEDNQIKAKKATKESENQYHRGGHQPQSQRKNEKKNYQPRQGSSISTEPAAVKNLEIQTDQSTANKFSQLVCQVPQGDTKPQMSPGHHFNQQPKQSPQTSDTTSDQKINYLLGPQRPSEAGRKTLVLDLDETLVHSSFKPVENPDITLNVDIEGQLCTIYVLVRPFVSEFMKRMAPIYELVIFTASLGKYAVPLVEQLDPDNFCAYKLFREHCTFYNNSFVKDLTRLGRPMTDIIILDNSPVAYLFQPENAMPAVSWYEDRSDEELLRVATLLERMAQEDDVRKVIRTIIVNNKIEPRQEQLYLSSTAAQQANSGSSRPHRRDKSHRVDKRGNTNALQSAPAPVHAHPQHTVQAQTDQYERRSDKHHQKGVVGSPTGDQQQQQPSVKNETHSRYDSSDGRTRHSALIYEQMMQKRHDDTYGAQEVPADNPVGDTALEIMLKRFKVTNQPSHEDKSQKREASRNDQRDQQTQQRNAAPIQEKRPVQKEAQKVAVPQQPAASSSRRNASRGRSSRDSEPQVQQINVNNHQQQQEQIYENHRQQIVQLRNEIAQLKSKQVSTPANQELEEHYAQLQDQAKDNERLTKVAQPSTRTKDAARGSSTLQPRGQSARRQRGTSTTKETDLANAKNTRSSGAVGSKKVQAPAQDQMLSKTVKLTTSQQNKMQEFLHSGAQGGPQSTRHQQAVQFTNSLLQQEAAKASQKNVSVNVSAAAKIAQNPTSTRSSNKQNSFAYFNGNQADSQSSRMKAEIQTKQVKSHTSHGTGRTQQSNLISNQSNSRHQRGQEVLSGSGKEELSQVVAMANKRERGQSAKPTTASTQPHRSSSSGNQHRGGSSHHIHAKAHQNFASEAGLHNQNMNNNSLILGQNVHQRAGSANPYHGRGKKNISTNSTSSHHHPQTIVSQVMPGTSKGANTMIGNLSHMLNGVTAASQGGSKSSGGHRTTTNSGSYHYERLNKNHSTGRVAMSSATGPTVAVAAEHSQRHQYNASAGMATSSPKMNGSNQAFTSGTQSQQATHPTQKQGPIKPSTRQQVQHNLMHPNDANQLALHELAMGNHPSTVTHAAQSQPSYQNTQTRQRQNVSRPVDQHQPNLQFAAPMSMMLQPASQTPQATASFKVTTPSAQTTNGVIPSSSQHLLYLNKQKKDLHEIMQQLTSTQGGQQSHGNGQATSKEATKRHQAPAEQQYGGQNDYLKKLKKQQDVDQDHERYAKTRESASNQICLLNHTQQSHLPSDSVTPQNQNAARGAFNDIRNVMQYSSTSGQPAAKARPSSKNPRTTTHQEHESLRSRPQPKTNANYEQLMLEQQVNYNSQQQYAQRRH